MVNADSLLKLFSEEPHFTLDNYFLHEESIQYFCARNFKLTAINMKGRLSSEVSGKFLHKKKLQVNHQTKAARFMQPVVAVKNYDGDGSP